MAKIHGGFVDSPKSALLIILGIIRDYEKDGTDKIKSKINEFSENGKINEASSIIEAHHQAYLLLYEYPIEKIPEYLGTPFDLLAVWRLSLPGNFLV